MFKQGCEQTRVLLKLFLQQAQVTQSVCNTTLMTYRRAFRSSVNYVPATAKSTDNTERKSDARVDLSVIVAESWASQESQQCVKESAVHARVRTSALRQTQVSALSTEAQSSCLSSFQQPPQCKSLINHEYVTLLLWLLR